MTKKKCVAIIITYNGKKWYDRCFQSLLSSSILMKIIAVDNKSTDDSVSYITSKFPEVEIIKNKENYGFAKANNIGLSLAYKKNYDYYFLLNQDAWVEYNTIETLITVAEKRQDFGIFSPIHLTADKTFFDKNFTKYFCNYSKTLHAYENLYLGKSEPILYESHFINAAAWLLSRKCIEVVGGFDTILFSHYGEDSNYCQRVLFHNLKIGIVPAVTVCHDRATRINEPCDLHIDYSVIWGNILKTYFGCLSAIFIMAYKEGRGIEGGIKGLIWAMKNIIKIHKSRKINKIEGKGQKYIDNIYKKKNMF